MDRDTHGQVLSRAMRRQDRNGIDGKPSVVFA